MMSETQLAIGLTLGMRSVAALADNPEREVAGYLDKELRHLPPEERLRRLEQVAQLLGGATSAQAAPLASASGTADLHRLVGRFLGNPAATETLAPAELAETFAAALDTMFDVLDQIVSTVGVTLQGEAPELETIGKVNGSNWPGETRSLQDYLETIRKAFLVAHDSYLKASEAVMAELFAELDPEALAAGKVSGLKFGALRKADLWDQYLERHRRCRRWLDSPEHRERLLREFEKQCRLALDGGARSGV